MNRREFLGWVGIGSLASYLPIVLAACSAKTPESTNETSSTPTASPAVANSDGFVAIGTMSDLEKNSGQISDKASAVGSILVVGNSAEPNNLLAVNPTCNHRNCSVVWEPDEKQFLCPCHGSKFSSSGELLNGPATESLAKYEVKVENESILVKVS